MRLFTLDTTDSGGSDSGQVPSGMDNDPNADEEVINQQTGSSSEQYPKAVEAPAEPARITPDNLSDSIAYALDGSGPGPMNETPNVTGHKVISEGITGAGPDEEEDSLRA